MRHLHLLSAKKMKLALLLQAAFDRREENAQEHIELWLRDGSSQPHTLKRTKRPLNTRKQAKYRSTCANEAGKPALEAQMHRRCVQFSRLVSFSPPWAQATATRSVQGPQTS